jgi:hypothetical protein
VTDVPADDWVTVASFKGVDGDLQADLVVTTLRGLGINAIRLPFLPTTCLPLHAWPMIQSARVLVRPEAEEVARETVGEHVPARTLPELRSFFRWWVAWLLLMAAGGTVETLSSRHGDVPGGVEGVFASAVCLVTAGIAVSVLTLVGALLRDGRLRRDVRPGIVALAVYALCALLVWPFLPEQRSTVFHHEVRDPLPVLVVYAVIAAAIALTVRSHKRRARERQLTDQRATEQDELAAEGDESDEMDDASREA